ncbi:MAG TPA: hypothetical protein PKL70_07400 [Saprospiraceae bacterium]|nr:hypothetical protein [Saprospiraceae bacterium]
MKKLFFMGMLALALMMATGCEKSTESPSSEPDTILNALALSNTEAQDAFTAVEELGDAALESRDNGSCPTITSTAPKGSFPNTVTIDFGSGCLSPSGRYHAGKIIIEQSDSMHHAGAVRTTSFTNFYVDSLVMKNGTITLKNEEIDEEGNLTFTRQVSNLAMTSPRGTLVTNALHTRTQVKGGGTPNRHDDAWKITGESQCTVDEEVKFSTLIKDALVLRGDCPFIVAGLEEVTRNGRTVLVNYGDGTCDRIARGTLENGDHIVIVLNRRN